MGNYARNIQRTLNSGVPNPILDGMVTSLEFEGNVLDHLGNHSGSLIGTPPTISGMVGNALDFNGSGHYAQFMNDLGFNSFPFSIELGIYYSTINGISDRILAYSGSGNYAGVSLKKQGEKFRLILGDNSSSTATSVTIHETNSNVIVPGWNHIQITATSINSVAFYIGGTFAPSTEVFSNATEVYWDVNYNLMRFDKNNSFEDAALDLFRVWNRTLISEEITTLYSNFQNGTSIH